MSTSVQEEPKYNRIDFPGFFKRNKITGTINFISWLLLGLAALLALIIFFVLNKTTVIGKKNIPKKTKNILFASNHISYGFDSFFIGIMACVPHAFFKDFYLPYHPTAYEQYYSNKVLTFFMKHLRCIPVKRKWKNEGGLYQQGEFDREGINKSIEALKTGLVIYFPEGTRSKDGSIGEGKPGAGMLPHETRAEVVPVRVENLDRLWPKGAKFLKMGQHLKITYGKPVYLDDLYDLPSSKETSKLITERIMAEIKKL
jgi:1-acyl-sn-glycerol-3-phosphate acyltransferase